MRKILIIGQDGQVGWELQRTLTTLGAVYATGRQQMDLSNPDSIRDKIREIKPDIIVNAAAYTAVDKAEAEPELAMAINGIAPGVMAEEAKNLGALLVHYSTDYVFDGDKSGPYAEQDLPNPINVYGKTKLAGEHAIQAIGGPYLVFRTSWVYGARGKNFLLTMFRLAKERDELRVVSDQIGAPTWSRMIAEATAQVLAQLYSPLILHHSPLSSLIAQLSGIYHLTANGNTSWHGFASLIVETLKKQGKVGSVRETTVMPIGTEAYPLPAQRPKDSRLSSAKLTKQFGVVMPAWDIGVRACLEELLANEVYCP